MSIESFTQALLLNRCLREGPFAGPRKAGMDTSLWASLLLLKPEKLPDGNWKGDAVYFFATPVHEPLVLLQTTLRTISREFETAPLPGENLTTEYIPRLVSAVADQKKETMGETIQMDVPHRAMITPLDASGLRAMMVSVFELADDDAEDQDEILTHVGQIVFEKFISDAYDMLSGDDQDKLEALIEKSEDPNDVMEFLEHRISDFDTVLAGKVIEVQKEYAELQKKINETPVQRGGVDKSDTEE